MRGGLDRGRLARRLSPTGSARHMHFSRSARCAYQLSQWTRSTDNPSVLAFLAYSAHPPIYTVHAQSAAPRSGVSDQPNSDALPPKLPKLVKFIKLIESRARRTSPQGHGRSLPDAVKTIDFASLLEGFWPNPSNRLRPRRASLRLCKNSNLRYCRSI